MCPLTERCFTLLTDWTAYCLDEMASEFNTCSSPTVENLLVAGWRLLSCLQDTCTSGCDKIWPCVQSYKLADSSASALCALDSIFDFGHMYIVCSFISYSSLFILYSSLFLPFHSSLSRPDVVNGN